ncbi:MAG: T9SS type A sorting domain-containing protein [Flavobacteriales bacterium]|nr:T9SS type A sorting domain-containing protein [Flavobacteriales bacterium]
MKAPLLMNKLVYTFALVAYGFISLAQDAGVTAVIAPSESNNLTMGTTYAVTVTIKNFGTAPIQDVPVKFVVGVNNALDEVYAGPIAAGASFNYTFTDSLVITNTLVGSGFAETNVIGDINTGNDKITTLYTYGVTGIFDNLEDAVGEITVYPNPVADALSLDYDGIEEVEVNIYNMAGELVVALGKYAGGTLKGIDVSDLESGTYLIQLTSEDGTSYKKFIK